MFVRKKLCAQGRYGLQGIGAFFVYIE